MSSLRNAAPRRTHRERAQPASRQKWGLLEKPKDYRLRARDFAAKQTRLRALRQKARDRNPDEFHFAMMSARSVGGVKVADRGNKALSVDVVRLLKTQDAGYLRMVGGRVRRERERVEEAVFLDGRGGREGGDGERGEGERKLGEGGGVGVLKGGEGRGSHTVYVESKDEQRGFDAEGWFGTDKDGLWRSWNRPRRQEESLIEVEDVEDAVDVQKGQRSKRSVEAKRQALKEERAARKKIKKHRAGQRGKLQSLKQREKDLNIAEQELELQRAKMSNSIGGVNKNGVKFKVRERKR